MPNSGATGYGAVSRHLWLLLWESSSLLDSCICLKVFLCRVQIYHLDPKHECWRLLGKEHDATTEILWPKGILKEPYDVAEESGAKGGGGGKGVLWALEVSRWRASPCGLGLLPNLTLPLRSPSSRFPVCSAPLFFFKKNKRQFPHNLTVPECWSQADSTVLLLFISAFRWWVDHHFLWQHQLAVLQAVHTSRFLQMPRASWPLDLSTRACLVLSPCQSSRVTPVTGGVTHSSSILAPPCFFLSMLAGHCLDRSPCRIWNYKPWSSFLQRWTSIFSTSCFPLDLLCDSISTSGALKVFLFFSKPESLLA